MKAKEIRYKAIANDTPAHECENGELDCAHNMAYDGACLTNMPEPTEHITIAKKCEILCRHSERYITASGEGLRNIMYTTDGTDIAYVATIPDNEAVKSATNIGNILIVTTDAYMHYMLWDDGMQVQGRQAAGGYKYLGTKLPELKPMYNCHGWWNHENQTTHGVELQTMDTPEPLPQGATYYATELRTPLRPIICQSVTEKRHMEIVPSGDTYQLSDEESETVTTKIFGNISELSAKARKLGLFFMPRLARCAYRMYDGSYAMYTAPTLLFNEGTLGNNATVRSDGYYETYINPFFAEIWIDGTEELERWKDIITGIAVFLSDEITDYDQNGKITTLTKTATDLDQYGHHMYKAQLPRLSQGEVAKTMANIQNFYKAHVFDIEKLTNNYHAVLKISKRTDTDFYVQGGKVRITLETSSDGVTARTVTTDINIPKGTTVSGLADFITKDTTLKGAGIICETISDSQSRTYIGASETRETDNHVLLMRTEGSASYCKITEVRTQPETTSQDDAYGDASKFRFHARNGCGSVLPPSKINLDTLLAHQSISDDYKSHNAAHANSAKVYNGRLNLSDVTMYRYDKPIRGLVATIMENYAWDEPTQTYWLETSLDNVETPEAAWFYIRTGKGEAVTQWKETSGEKVARQFMNYIYYPDGRCHACRIRSGNGTTAKYLKLQLETSDFMNGSVFTEGTLPYVGIQHDPFSHITREIAYMCESMKQYEDKTVTQDPTPKMKSERTPNLMMQSEAANPFVFTADGHDEIGGGTILATAAATATISTGQFGEYPLYAFCTDGIYAVQTTASGRNGIARPVSGVKLSNKNCMASTGDSVAFISNQGLMEITGGTVRCLSEKIRKRAFNPAELPKWEETWNAAVMEKPTDIPCTFLEFANNQSARMSYDPTNRRIFITHNGQSQAYVYHMANGGWTTMTLRTDGTIENFPEALCYRKSATQDKTTIISLSTPDCTRQYTKPGGQTAQRGASGTRFIVTRPIKLTAGALSTIKNVIQRGEFQRTAQGDKASQVLYGSRDLTEWHVIASSSKSRYIKRNSGTPYRFYRLLVIPWFDNGGSVSEATIEYEDKYTNKQR